jgi:putrescine transport system substrate-binding protein
LEGCHGGLATASGGPVRSIDTVADAAEDADRPRLEDPTTMRPRPLAALAAVLALSLAACGGRPETQPQGEATKPAPAPRSAGVVNIYNWSDYITPETLERFTRETGIRVVYDVYDSDEVLEAKLVTGNTGYDLVFPSLPFAQRHIAAGLYGQLDKEKLPSLGNLYPDIVAAVGAEADPGNAYLVPYMWGTTGLGFNVAKVRERLGDVELDTWAILFDPANAAKLADCGISVIDESQEAFAAALFHAGRDPNGASPEDIEAVRAAFAAIRPHIRYFHSSKYIEDLANGEICLAVGYNGDVLQAAARAEEAGNGIEIGYAIPREGAMRWIDSMAIPSDAPNRDNAHRFIEFILQPDVIAPISDYVNYANANRAATPLVSEAVREDPGIYPSEEVMARLVSPRKLPEDQNRARVRAWTSIKSGR